VTHARYVADPEHQLETVALDGLVLIYHRPSGMTHIVAPPAPQILEALRLGPADAGEIVARMRAWYALEGDEAAKSVEARLEELEAAGLIARETQRTLSEAAELPAAGRLPDLPDHLDVPGRGRRFRDQVIRRAVGG
jgi:PqqD family protein of HPr-rel-A system